MFVSWDCCVLSGRGLWRRADHSSRDVLPTVVRRCVWSRNLKNETMVRTGQQRYMIQAKERREMNAKLYSEKKLM